MSTKLSVMAMLALLGVARQTGAQPEPNLYELDTQAQKAPPPSSALDRVLKSLYVRVCVRSDVAPFGSFSQGTLAGFDIDLAREITNQLGIDYKQALGLEWVVVDAEQRIKRVADGACDLVVADLSYTKERAAQIGTSKVYLRTDKVLVGAKRITRKMPVIAKLAGATGDAGIPGTTKELRTYQEIIHAMDNGEVDYVVTDRPIADHLIRSTVTPFQVTKTLAENAESYVVGVAKGSPELLAAVNRALEDLARNGRLALIARRWL